MEQATIKKYAVIALLSLVAATVIYVLLSYTLVTISPQTSASPDVTLKFTSLSSKKTKSYTMAASDQKKVIIRRGAYNLTATQGKNQTVSSFTAHRFTDNQLSVQLRNEASVSRVATSSLGCGKQYGGSYYSYRCGGEIRVLKHTAFQGGTRASSQLLGASSTYRSLIQHKGGVLGIIDNQEGGISIETIDLPAEKSRRLNSDFIGEDQDTSGYTLVANNASSYQYEFAIVDQKTGTWRLYTNINDGQPREIKVATNISDIQKYSMVNQSNQLKGNDIISLYDIDTDKGEGSTTRSKKITNRNLVVTTNIQTGVVTSYTLPDTQKYTAIWQTDPTHLIGKTPGGQAIVYDLSNDTTIKVAEYDNVTGLSVYNSTTLLGLGKGIYKMSLDGSTIFRLFESDYLNLSTITQDASGIGFTAFVNKTNSLYILPDAYRIDLDKPAIYPQDQEYLPYNDSAVRSMDYSDTQIQVQLAPASLSFDRRTGQASYDAEEFKQLTEEVRADLSEKNLIRGREIIFTY